MYLLYGIVYTLGFIVMLPRFLFDLITRGKYGSGLKQRFGFLPELKTRSKRVVWVHCVSVGETNAARPLVKLLKERHPEFSIVVSTTTKTGQKLAQELFGKTADLVFYFPFDWRSTVRRALRHIRPSFVLLMETEIWFNFLREGYKSGARIAIVNGRLSERSFSRFGKMKKFMKRVLGYLDLALMQDKADATRLMSLGIRGSKVKVTGNIKFDHEVSAAEAALTETLRDRFGISGGAPLIIAASTHAPEEAWVLDAFKQLWKGAGRGLPRLLIAPRHPERFTEVGELIRSSGFAWARRSDEPSDQDGTAEVILLDSIGELRAAYPLATLVFVGGSLIPHGGQSLYEPAAAGLPIITGPHTQNFAAATTQFLARSAIRQIDSATDKDAAAKLAAEFRELLTDAILRKRLAENARAVMQDNRGAVLRTADQLEPMFNHTSGR